MAPKKAGGKKAELVELAKASTLPDGPRNYFIGGWSSNTDLTAITTISDIVKPISEEAEPLAPQVNIMVLPGTLQHADNAVVRLTHGLNIKGLLPQQQLANRAAYEAKRKSKNDQGEAEEAGNAPVDGEETKPDKPACKVILANDAVQVHGSIAFQGIKPPVVVAPVVEQEKKAAPEKGAKKKTDEDRAREAEAQRLREEAAIRVAKEEEERLSKFAIPRRWPKVNVSNLAFYGPVTIAGAHINFVGCSFLSLEAAGPMSTNMVEVGQYCKVTFTNCSFAQPARSALYAFPLADVTARNCVFSGVDQPHSAADVAAVLAAGGPSPAAVEMARAARPDAVGVHTDSAKLLVDDCLFEALGTGVIVRGSYALQPTSAGPADADKEKSASGSKPVVNSMVVQRSDVRNIFGTGVLADKASGFLLQSTKMTLCGYYAAQFRGGGAVQVLRNTFANAVLIHRGAGPFLHSNVMCVPLIDKNDVESLAMQTTY
jgi:hypothetical protein